MIRRNKYTVSAGYALLLFLCVVTFFSCSKKENPPVAGDDSAQAGCVSCHTNYEKLKQIAAPDTSTGGGGCGGDAPHIETYDRVYLGGDGYTAFQSTAHGKMECVTCHGGDVTASEKTMAHGSTFINHPSLQASSICGPCHSSETTHAANSIHAQGWGQKSMVTLRYGATSFDALPATLKSGYDVNCGKCHGTCGDCHVNRPKAGGGGLLKGHLFFRTPDMRQNCTACHTSRGGHAYFGVAPGSQPDIHLSKLPNGGHCLGCHSGTELHGDGQVYDQRYKVPALPKCETCHANLASKNAYHSMHLTTFNCQTCHSQDYNNCGSCHIGGEGARIPSYQGFKIGMNPISPTRTYKYATLRRSLMAPDSWKEYGVPQLANFDVRPTYKYATPHNIQRWTKRTQVDSGKSCSNNCHVIQEGSTFRNKELYLFNSDLQSWEVNADQGIVVDGKLPSVWGVQ